MHRAVVVVVASISSLPHSVPDRLTVH
eukprot:COSAG04_NODE_29645_length_267_cov_1.476190_1_plen_26_part_10